MQSLSDGLSTLKVEGKALHPFSDIRNLSFYEEVPHESGISGYSAFANFR